MNSSIANAGRPESLFGLGLLIPGIYLAGSSVTARGVLCSIIPGVTIGAGASGALCGLLPQVPVRFWAGPRALRLPGSRRVCFRSERQRWPVISCRPPRAASGR
jgi:hypothetical protein